MVNAAEVAAKFGISVKTVQRALARKEIPGLVIGTVYLVNAGWFASVTAWPPAQEMAS
jgi:hypothetical protein